MGKIGGSKRLLHKGKSFVLEDSFGRVLDYLRVSVTDRCNLRCIYCMPPEGVPWKPHADMLTFEETLRICRIMAELGIRKIKITGGEPLVRKGMASFLRDVKNVCGIEKVTLTTNGLLLGAFLDEAETLGCLPDGVNISLDALSPERYSRITGKENSSPEEILRNIDRLLGKQVWVKINCVPILGFNEEEIIPLVLLAKDRNIAVRFIELMPLGAGADYGPLSGAKTSGLVEKAFGPLTPFSGIESNGPALYYSLEGFTGKLGLISALSEGFCKTCNRLRLTSEGFLKPCLSSAQGYSLRDLLRKGSGDNELINAIKDVAAKKPQYHTFSQVYGGDVEKHSDGMSGIGG